MCVLQEDWATSGPWRAYYHQRGSLPLRRNHSLPPKLVQSFIPSRCHIIVCAAGCWDASGHAVVGGILPCLVS